MKANVLFLCAHNSIRSQMAEGWLRHFYGENHEGFSAGIEPGILDPLAVRVMKEVGIDISGQRPKNVDLFLNKNFDYIITSATKPARPAHSFLAARLACIKALKIRRSPKGRKKKSWPPLEKSGTSSENGSGLHSVRSDRWISYRTINSPPVRD